jgi:phosphonate transport system substrate-binding protein
MIKYLGILVLSMGLSACQVFVPTPVESLSITFSPSVIPSDLEAQFPYFEAALKAALLEEGYDLKSLDLSVEASNQAVEDKVRAGLTDLAYVRVNNYLSLTEEAQSFLTLAQKGYVFNQLEDYQSQSTDDISQLVTHQRSLILSTPSRYGRELRQKLSDQGKLSWIDLNQARWCHILVTSYEGYLYPSLWLIENYQRRIGEVFSRSLMIKGYEELMERAAKENCDIIVGPQSLRDAYASQWNTLRQSVNPNQTHNIYQDLYPIGMSQAYYHDLFVISKQATHLDERFIEALRRTFLKLHENQHALFKTLNIEGLVYVEDEHYLEMLPAYQYLKEITR